MRADKRAGLMRGTTLSILLAVGMSGCSDYPSEGILDTDLIRSKAKVVEVSGDVYGVKPGTMEALQNYELDKDMVKRYPAKLWDARNNGQPSPTFELTYKGISVKGLDHYPEMAEKAVKEARDKIDADIKARQKELNAAIAELQHNLADVKDGAAKFNEAVKGEKKAYEDAKAYLDAAIDEYNKTLNQPLDVLRTIASKHNLGDVPDYRNPLKSYRHISFKKGRVPSACPSKRGYTAVDLRAEERECYYFDLASRFTPYADKIKPALKTALIGLPKAKEALGHRRSWSSKATGAYAAVGSAEDAYKAAQRKAYSQYGDERGRARKQQQLEYDIKRKKETLAQVSSDEYLKQQIESVPMSIYGAKEMKEVRKNYIAAMEKDVFGKMEKVTTLVSKGEKGQFEGFDGDYEGLVVHAKVLAENRGRRKALQDVEFFDLTGPSVSDLEKITVPVTQDGIKEALHIGRKYNGKTVEEVAMELMSEHLKRQGLNKG